jgi:hypothetical protein
LTPQPLDLTASSIRMAVGATTAAIARLVILRRE